MTHNYLQSENKNDKIGTEKGENKMIHMYTINEFCRMFNISRKTLYRWKTEGIVKTIKVKGKSLISEVEITKLLSDKHNSSSLEKIS